MRYRVLLMALRWSAVVLVLRVLGTILANYPDYFPPNFDSLFLQGREHTFFGAYEVAFYVHIGSAPFVLIAGLLLLSERLRKRYRRGHRILGRVQVLVLLTLMLPSGAGMALRAFGGWPAGLSFFLLSVLTAVCAVAGVVYARKGRYDRHRRWMMRCFVLLCSAVALRLTSGAASVVGVSSPESAYALAAWGSWLVPLTVFEVAERVRPAGYGRRGIAV